MFRALLESGVLGRHRGLPATVIVTMTLEQLEKAVGGLATTAKPARVPGFSVISHAEPVGIRCAGQPISPSSSRRADG
ncbi:DUF222 domain-containing protein [Rhodococcus sp. T7]|uniref:DUF222 domain-containing protein n=1 Tax=Rhodococcus sp. T7 TaxID=627444 RepID=UPI002E2C2B62|nr:DUF222 domain-containing protein [Rhodococcus sp. T7]